MIHSFEYIEESRLQWWNADFLDLLAIRFELGKARDILEIGVGAGHWSRLLLKRVASEWTFRGLDIEEHWVQEAQRSLQKEFGIQSAERLECRQGDAHSLPYPNQSFDLVTCQTVLMHLHDPIVALREMRRVLREGGSILCAEPINVINRFDFSTVTETVDTKSLVSLYRLWICFQRGIKNSSKGDHNIGAYLPALLASSGFRSLQAYTNDKAAVVSSPYAESDLVSEWEDEGVIRESARAGGADEGDIATGLAALKQLEELKREQVIKGAFCQTGISALLVIGGRR